MSNEFDNNKNDDLEKLKKDIEKEIEKEKKTIHEKKTNNIKKKNDNFFPFIIDILFLLLLVVIIYGLVTFFMSMFNDENTRYEKQELIQVCQNLSYLDGDLKVYPLGIHSNGQWIIYGKYSSKADDRSPIDTKKSKENSKFLTGKNMFYCITTDNGIHTLEEEVNNYNDSNSKKNNSLIKISRFSYKTSSSNPVSEIILNIVHSLIFMLLYVAVFIYVQKSIFNDDKPNFIELAKVDNVNFDSVAGCDEEKEELKELVDCLKNPDKYSSLGARAPKGIILFGPPGTGKTLLAKALAGEASVPFIALSGSDFESKWVGVGQERVKQLFKTAKQNAPCIIYIDEIDALASKRDQSSKSFEVSILNQLLTQLDGFKENQGILVMASTNRKDAIDPALLRPGRFDRQIFIPLPDIKARKEILEVHAKNKKVEDDVNFLEVARQLSGFSGAELENTLNEAAMLAARSNRLKINFDDICEAADRVIMGPAKKSRKYTEKEKKLVAYHEAGHAVVSIFAPNSTIIEKITIIPRGEAGGYNRFSDEDNEKFPSENYLKSRIMTSLGGRLAEELIFGEKFIGASQDIIQLTQTARLMVENLGMSEIGPIDYTNNNSPIRQTSEATKEQVDIQVKKIVDYCYKEASEIIKKHTKLLDKIAFQLLEKETITRFEIEQLVKEYKDEN